MTGVRIRGEKERDRDKREKTIWGYSGKKKKKVAICKSRKEVSEETIYILTLNFLASRTMRK